MIRRFRSTVVALLDALDISPRDARCMIAQGAVALDGQRVRNFNAEVVIEYPGASYLQVADIGRVSVLWGIEDSSGALRIVTYRNPSAWNVTGGVA